ncbi:MAG: hypothetical protein ACREIS_03250 [Nitrospiraceae bacterium]
MFKEALPKFRELLNGAAWSLYHVVVVALSAAIALSLPAAARNFLAFWSRVENEKIYLIAMEITAAIVLILCFNYVHRSLRDRTLAKMATGAGLVSFFPRRGPRAHRRGPRAQRRIKQLKEEHGTGRTVMVIGSSGYATFVDQVGDLSTVLEKCLGAKILLVNPYGQEASTRIRAIAHPDFTLENFRGEVRQSIELLKRLKALGKSVKLKLYSDPPLVKLVILGDYLWLQHYHTDLDVQTMPEYVLQHNLKDHGLYTLCYQYFVQRWESTEIPEYDLDTDELVYRGHNGSEVRRERFGPEEASEGVRQGVGHHGLAPDAGTAQLPRAYEAELLPDSFA